MNKKHMIKLSLQTGPGEAGRFVHPVVWSSLQSQASEEQQPLAQQPSPQPRQLWCVYLFCKVCANLHVRVKNARAEQTCWHLETSKKKKDTWTPSLSHSHGHCSVSHLCRCLHTVDFGL